MFKSSKKDNDGQLGNIIVQGTIIKGNINSEASIRIDGSLEGNTYCKSNLWVGKSAVIQGDIETKNGVVEGTVHGKIVATETLNLKTTAKVSGDVEAKGLNIEEGAAIKGMYTTGSYTKAGQEEVDSA